jgi:hypothetical protein
VLGSRLEGETMERNWPAKAGGRVVKGSVEGEGGGEGEGDSCFMERVWERRDGG